MKLKAKLDVGNPLEDKFYFCAILHTILSHNHRYCTKRGANRITAPSAWQLVIYYDLISCHEAITYICCLRNLPHFVAATNSNKTAMKIAFTSRKLREIKGKPLSQNNIFLI